MKAAPFLLILLFIFFALATKPSSSEEAAEPEAVLDTNGDKVRAGTEYYILPVFRGRGGGLTMESRGNKTSCPLDVVQDRYEVSKGLPLIFTPLNSKKGVVLRVSTDLNIKFYAASTCVQSTVWKLDSYDESRKQWFVTTSGVEGNPGPKTVTGSRSRRMEMTTTFVSAPQCVTTVKFYAEILGFSSMKLE